MSMPGNFIIILGVQYCDGIRGPLVVYDPNDPHKDLYDGQ